jgi:serine/threonine protein kinase
VPPSAPRLIDHSLAEDDRDVFLSCAKGFGQEFIHVKPLGRYGYTAARLFLVRFDRDGVGAPYVIKIDKADAIRREAEAMTLARSYFHDAIFYDYYPDVPNGKAALLYRLFGQTDTLVTELRDIYTEGGRSAEVCDTLKVVYDYCRVAHRSRLVSQPWGDTYKWYLRPNRPDRIETAFPDSRKYIECSGRTYRHPTRTLHELAAEIGERSIGFVHGDLHPNNVVLATDNVPAIIDFAWARGDGDVLQDFVLMECSFRFLLFPRHVDWREHHRVAVDFAREDGPDIVTNRFLLDPNLAHSRRYIEMSEAVAAVRLKASEVLSDTFHFDDYLKAQYLVLYGLTKLDTYPFWESLDALGDKISRGEVS